ncbi:unnamed protein product [Macrosiphum euphorbiae]|uniref:tRNA selenocysteine-associated protein 1 n=1 Tax=Macrosiphum euphorbiae TaxID=13131 RepID=A0AAV0Y901_9HEMI|nr:unnamed protein product [Macrosiphum euphorbiae]
MYTNQYTPQNSRYDRRYQQYPCYNHQIYINYYNQHPSYNAQPLTQTIATLTSSNVPTVQQPQVSTPRQNVTSLWMGNVQPFMTKRFITWAFQTMGEYPIKVMLRQHKHPSMTPGYAFVEFCDPGSTMHKLNGKYIPGTHPPLKFKLNHAGKINTSDNSFSVWCGELSSDVDDFQLYKTFKFYYPSIHTANVVFDSYGNSKGYGFIRFLSEEELKHCLKYMNGFLSLGSKPLKVNSIKPKSKRHIVVSSNDSRGCNASQSYIQYSKAVGFRPESENCLLRLKPTIGTTGNSNQVGM